MKKTLFIISTLAATLCACGGTKKNSVVSTADESKVEQVTDTCNSEQDIAVIQTFYEKCVFCSSSPDDQYASEHVTANMMDKLCKANPYDGGGMAYFVLRTELQDGDGPSQVTAVEPIQQGWYKVSFVDMGQAGVMEIKMENGKLADYREVQEVGA